jgi:16S rRNA processing protein RimM
MGRISAPFGIKGWVRVQPFTAEAEGLQRYQTWWLGNGADWRECAVERFEVQGAGVVALLAGCGDRDAAAALRGQVVAVPRSAFPAARQDEFYWADLVGLGVRNSEGLALGVVTAMLETGANDVMVVKQETADGEERLIPFVAEVVKRVDMAARVIEVDWGADFLRD